MMKKLLTHIGILIFLLAMTINAHAQNERKFIRQGNKLFEQALQDTTKLDTASFNKAEIAYRKALDKRPNDQKWNFNLGDALYKQKKFDQATTKFEDIAKNSTDQVEKARAYHNIGNSMLMQNKLDESIEAYKNALRNNPNDLDSKYNLIYAMDLKKQQQKQQNKDKNKDKDKDKDKDKNKDQNKDQNKNQDKKKDQDKDKQKQDQNKDQQNKNQDQKKQQQQPQQQKISKENAERLLQALQNDEEKVQEKVKKAKAAKAKQRQIDKDW